MSMRPRPWPEPSEEIVAAVQAMYPGRTVPLPVAIRDQLGEVFDASVLSEFRARLIAHGWEEQVLDTLLARLGELGLVKAGGKQRTDPPT